jgi:hypothetical protein
MRGIRTAALTGGSGEGVCGAIAMSVSFSPRVFEALIVLWEC